MKRIFSLIALLIPIIAMITFWYQAQSGAIGERIEVPITGYDPVDLLSGHFVRYRLDLGELDACKPDPNYKETPGEDTGRCVCFMDQPNTTVAKPIWAGACSQRPTNNCPKLLRGVCDEWRFAAGVEAFYIPEAYASKFATLPPNSTIVISLSPEGEGQVIDLKIDGKHFSDYVKQP